MFILKILPVLLLAEDMFSSNITFCFSICLSPALFSFLLYDLSFPLCLFCCKQCYQTVEMPLYVLTRYCIRRIMSAFQSFIIPPHWYLLDILLPDIFFFISRSTGSSYISHVWRLLRLKYNVLFYCKTESDLSKQTIWYQYVLHLIHKQQQKRKKRYFTNIKNE